MKAVIWTAYGTPDVLQVQEVEKPSPKPNEVLIKVHAATVTIGDAELRSLKFPFPFTIPLRFFIGFRKPERVRILGQELAGEIEAVGGDVKRYKAGDAVFAWCGFGLGAYAEYKCLAESAVMALKPSSMSFEEAATLSVGGLEATYFVRSGHIQSRQKVLINGAGGSIGTYGVQLARYFGAEVTAVDSAGKLDMLRSIGADHVIDYTREDFSKSSERYDVILDTVGKGASSRCMRALTPNGIYLAANPGMLGGLQARWVAMTGSKKMVGWVARTARQYAEDSDFLKGLIEAGKVKAVVDRVYPLEATAEAHRYVDSGQKKGSVVIRVGGDNQT